MKTADFDPKPLAATLKTFRESLDMTQLELATKAGMRSAAISHFETGLRTPSVPNIIRLCRALNVSPNRLLTQYLT